MTTLASRPSAAIARLELHGTGLDPVGGRLRAERLFDRLALVPRALDRRAILCVRLLRDPLPGLALLHGASVDPPRAWAAAVEREVERLARAAAWPARDAVPAGAEAVSFADEAELLACLGSDLVLGALGGRWWWPLLVGRGAEGRRAVAETWRASIEHAPAALARLASWRRARDFAVALHRDDTAALGDAIERRFALAKIPAEAPPAHEPGASAVDEGAATGRTHDRAGGGATGQPPPWDGLVEEAAAPGLTRSEQALLGVGLALVRAPAFARSLPFAAALARWRAGDAAGASGSGPAPPTAADRAAVRLTSPPAAEPARPPGATRALGTPAPPERSAAPPASAIPVQDPAPADAGPARSPADEDARAPAPAFAFDPLTPLAPGTGPVEDAPAAAGAAPPAEIGAPDDAPPTAWTAPVASARPPLSSRPRTRAFGARTDTGLGGLFYLINLALYLDLYGDEQNLPLPVWDFVTLVGRALLGEPPPPDPVWPLLAELSGRAESDPPGAGFLPSDDWRLRPGWLAALPGAPLERARAQGRWRVVHPDGFLVLDLPETADVGDALRAYPGVEVTDAETPPAGDRAVSPAESGLERWLARLVPYVRARLRRALDATDVELPELLLTHEAHVHASETHLDVVLSLEKLPLAIRFAGLDRDPGWVAAAGRFVAFHFE